MKPNLRSVGGALLMLLIVPVLAGLLACMPVPIGNPERSRIDPELSGPWFLEMEDEFDGLYQLRPFDKRSWLMVGVSLDEGEDYAGEPFDIDTTEDAVAALERLDVGDDGITAEEAIMFKVWLTKLGGQSFMTWELLGGFDEDGFEVPEIWYVFRVEKRGEDRVELFWVDGEHEVFAGLEAADEARLGHEYPQSVRRKWERALRKAVKNIDDEDLYDSMWVLQRVPEPLLDDASSLFGEVFEKE